MNAVGHDLLALCRRVHDPDARPIAVHPGHNGTAILRAATATGEVIVKIHRGVDRHRQEIHAYQHWTPVLGNRTPKLLAISDDPPGVVITCQPGIPLAEACLAPEFELEAHRRAGEALHAFHAAGPPRAEPDMTLWLVERGDYWLAIAGDHLSRADRAEIRAHLRELTQLGPISAVPCHLDYTPRNILVTAAGQISVIDFEHARYDLAARDLVRLATRIWPTRPDLQEAFLLSYGPIAGLDRQVVVHCARLDRLTASVRAATPDRATQPVRRR